MNLPHIKFGLSLPCTELSELNALPDIPETFEYLELTGDLINEAAALYHDHRLLSEFESLNFRNLIPAPLTRQLDKENAAIVHEYKRQLRDFMQKAQICHAECVSLDPDWETLLTNAERQKVFDDILRSTAGDREYFNIDLAIAVRLPGSGQFNVTESLTLLRKLANYRVDLVLDINPHELLNSQINWHDFLQHFRFDTACVRICYESELGNKLLKKHIEDIINALGSWQRDLTVYWAPSGKADLAGLAALSEEFKTESK